MQLDGRGEQFGVVEDWKYVFVEKVFELEIVFFGERSFEVVNEEQEIIEHVVSDHRDLVPGNPLLQLLPKGRETYFLPEGPVLFGIGFLRKHFLLHFGAFLELQEMLCSLLDLLNKEIVDQVLELNMDLLDEHLFCSLLLQKHL